MGKIGILTFHYSTNYGGLLQCEALYQTLFELGLDVEVINYIPSNYNKDGILKKLKSLGLNKNVIKNNWYDVNYVNTIIRKIKIKKRFSEKIKDKFNNYREEHLKLGRQVNEYTIHSILSNYDTIIVGSDQVWNPSQRKRPEYFLNYDDSFFKGMKISYAADSTIEEVDITDIDYLKKTLDTFSYISVRNEHSFEFVKTITGKESHIVADPTILYDFKYESFNPTKKEDYILTYVLGKEIEGTHDKAIQKIKDVYGDLPVYSIKIPTINFELSNFSDKVFYDLDPSEWLNMIKNAKFIYTDSFHGTLFSLKYHKPFLAYYTEKMRATRFIDLGKRYSIEKYIVENVEEIEQKGSIAQGPDFRLIDNLVEGHKHYSLEIIERILKRA